MFNKNIIILSLFVLGTINAVSNTITLVPILHALKKADTFLENTQWNTVNESQALLIQDYMPKSDELALLSAQELQSCASRDVQVVNNFLHENNFSITLDPLSDPRGFAVAAVMKILCEWKNPGEKAWLFNANKSDLYDGVAMKKGYAIAQPEYQKNAILSIQTKSNDTVFLTIPDKVCENFKLLRYIAKLTMSPKKDVTNQYNNALFPMVNLNQQVSLDWMKNMNRSLRDKSGNAYIDQALQQTKFQMDEIGAKAESAVALAMQLQTYCIPSKPDFIISEPFLAWIVRKKDDGNDMSIPLFAGYIKETDFKNPNK